MKVFIIAGKAGSGKDVVGKYLYDLVESANQKACILRFTKPLYEYAKNYFGWDGNVKNKPRDLFQTLGYDIIQKKLGKKYFLVNRLLEDISILKNYFDIFIIPDGRLIQEFEYVKKVYPNTIIIKVVRENYDNGLSPNQRKHITETNLDDYQHYDYIITNSHKDKLYQEVQKIVETEVRENE